MKCKDNPTHYQLGLQRLFLIKNGQHFLGLAEVAWRLFLHNGQRLLSYSTKQCLLPFSASERMTKVLRKPELNDLFGCSINYSHPAADIKRSRVCQIIVFIHWAMYKRPETGNEMVSRHAPASLYVESRSPLTYSAKVRVMYVVRVFRD